MQLIVIFILIISILTSCGYNSQDQLNKKMLLAIMKHDVNLMSELIKQGANVNYIVNPDDDKFSILQEAVMEKDIPIVELLLKNGANVNYENIYNRAIHLACYSGNAKMVKLLIDYGSEVNCVNRRNNDTPIQCASSVGSLEIINLLLENGADPKKRNNIGYNALMRAVFDNRSSSKVIELLFNHVNMNEVSNNGDTALTIAIHKGNLESVKTLLNLGANPNKVTSNSKTPIIEAVCYREKDIVETLLNCKGIDVNATDYQGITALRHAKVRNYNEIAKMLENAGAKEFVDK